ncbi:hypothetical protein DFH06DRAFT_1136063 [Mycena polygramma]|nr:hypothetical protein DFH06DRAFT_1136063 [Mycena polygramma]
MSPSPIGLKATLEQDRGDMNTDESEPDSGSDDSQFTSSQLPPDFLLYRMVERTEGNERALQDADWDVLADAIVGHSALVSGSFISGWDSGTPFSAARSCTFKITISGTPRCSSSVADVRDVLEFDRSEKGVRYDELDGARPSACLSGRCELVVGWLSGEWDSELAGVSGLSLGL